MEDNKKSSEDAPTIDQWVDENNSDSTAGESVPLSPPAKFLSIHRRNLNRIAEDAAQNKRHLVPDRREAKSGYVGKKTVETYCNTMSQKSFREWAETLLPMYKWLKVYNWKTTLLTDVIAGCTVGVMVVPQSMSYAKLAGLPVEYGLYSALVPVYAYALFGSSRQLAVGPVALISLLLSTGLSKVLEHVETSDPNYKTMYTTLAVQTAFLVGVAYIFMGLLRLGFVTIFLSHAVISGFTTGAAVIIGMSQVKYIFGYNVERSDVLHELIHNILKGISEFNYKTFLMGMSSILALAGLKYIGKNFPKYKWVRALGPLLVTAVTIVVTYAFDLSEKGIPIVGKIPSGLPPVTVGLWTPVGDFGKIFPTVISITIVGFMESIAIAKQLASIHKYELDSSMELIGMGMANFMGAMFGAYPVTGSFSRSAVNNESGAQSGVSGMVTATIVAFVLLFLTPVFEQLPQAVLGAIVISGVLGLLDYDEAMYLWRVHKFDFGVWVIACLGTMFLGVEIGLAIAVGVSLLLVTYESAYPHTAVLGRLPGTTVYRNTKQYPEAERYDGIVMVRVDAPIYFANTQNVREKLQKYERQAEEELAVKSENGRVQFLILEMSPVSHVDTSALHILQDMNKTYSARGIQLCFSNPSVNVMERFVTSGLADEVGREHFFVTIHDALQWCLHHMDVLAVSVHENLDQDVEVGN
jgi:sulfate transporter 4